MEAWLFRILSPGAYGDGRPGATEDVKWGEHLVFSVAGKMFAIFDVSDAEPVRLKVDPAIFPILTRKPGISAAP